MERDNNIDGERQQEMKRDNKREMERDNNRDGERQRQQQRWRERETRERDNNRGGDDREKNKREAATEMERERQQERETERVVTSAIRRGDYCCINIGANCNNGCSNNNLLLIQSLNKICFYYILLVFMHIAQYGSACFEVQFIH